MQPIRALIPLVVALFTATVFTAFSQPATPTFTTIEKEIVEALLQQDFRTKGQPTQTMEEIASAQGVQLGKKYDEFARVLRKQAKKKSPPVQAALEDFLLKSRQPVKVGFPDGLPEGVELIPTTVMKQIFDGKGPDSKPNGWDIFYQRFPKSTGLLSISRVGIDPHGTVALVYLGKQSHYTAGSGQLHILKREGKKWVLTRETLGPMWVS